MSEEGITDGRGFNSLFEMHLSKPYWRNDADVVVFQFSV